MNSPAIRKMTKMICAALTQSIVAPRKPVSSILSAANAPDQMLDMRDRRVGHDPMAEIEDMGTRRERRKDAVDRGVKRGAARNQRERIEIALHRELRRQ